MTTIRYSLGLKTIYLSIAAAAISLFLVIGMKNRQSQSNVVSATPISADAVTPTTTLEVEVIMSQISSDGTKKLNMKTTDNKNNSKTYTFSTSDGSGANEQIVFSKTLDFKRTMSIPYNTWSPDNKYFFIQEHGEEGDSVMVFNALGELFANQEKYLDLTGLFKQSGNKNNFSVATGWAAQNLVIFNTTTQENTKGPSFWFEVPSRAIIQLSTQF